ncbi:glycosyltransferase family 9 protein [Dissulfurimicrobium sp.]|uniref:glycosyltransferase family 9 protein n=1 Tax=Dissulfurimicrobium sp. TaxID=2022436 RepID=UPI003D0DA3FC
MIIKLSAIGDVVQSLPVLAALRMTFSDAHIGWVVGEAASGLLDAHPMLDELIVFPRKGLGELASNPADWPKFLYKAATFLRRLRLRDYDFVVDLQGLFKSGFVTLFSRGKVKIGFSGGRELSSIFLNKRLPAYDPNEHAVTRYLRLAAHLGAKTDKPEFPTGLDDKDRARLDQLLRDLGISKGPLICLIPGAAWTSKRWTSRGFSEVAGYCIDRLGLMPVIAGGAGDKGLAGEIVSLAGKGIIDLTGRTDLKMLAALFERTSVVVSTDTGPMHLAAAVGTPVVALFGPTAPWRTGPFGKRHQVLRLETGCSPCFKRMCQDPVCMTGIKSSDVIAAVLKAVKENTARA